MINTNKSRTLEPFQEHNGLCLIRLYETRLSHPTRSLPAVTSRLRLNRILKLFWENNECRLFAFCIADQNGHPKLMLVFCQNSLFVQDRRHSSNFPFLSSFFSVRLPFYLILAAMDPSSDGDGERFTAYKVSISGSHLHCELTPCRQS